MKKLFKWIKRLVMLVLVLAGAGIGSLYVFFPKVSSAADLKVEATPEMIARGNYLTHHVSGCVVCHGEMDHTRWGTPFVPGTEGKGGLKWTEEMGLPGTLNAPNITPAGKLAEYTDGKIYRAITAGVKRDGSVIFPIMPYTEHAHMDPEDVKSIIAYLRTIPPIKNDVPATSINFPVSMFIRMAPADPPSDATRPSKSDSVAYGEYMVNLGGCMGCHTEQGMSGPNMEKAFAGGAEFKDPIYGTCRSANLTSDKETGLGNWTAETFVNKFKTYADVANCHKVNPGDPFTVMPWNSYAGMDTTDLRCIYQYLQTIKPIANKVERFTAKGK